MVAEASIGEVDYCQNVISLYTQGPILSNFDSCPTMFVKSNTTYCLVNDMKLVFAVFFFARREVLS